MSASEASTVAAFIAVSLVGLAFMGIAALDVFDAIKGGHSNKDEKTKGEDRGGRA